MPRQHKDRTLKEKLEVLRKLASWVKAVDICKASCTFLLFLLSLSDDNDNDDDHDDDTEINDPAD